jgi:hypothetical protein
MWRRAPAGKIVHIPLSRPGEVDVLHWKPRLVALTAVLALVLIALAGLGTEIAYNLYW